MKSPVVKRSIVVARHDHMGWREVYETGLEQKRSIGAYRCGSCSSGRIVQLLGEVHAKAIGLSRISRIEDDVPRGPQARRCLDRSFEQRQRDRSSRSVGADIHARERLNRYVECPGSQQLNRARQLGISE